MLPADLSTQDLAPNKVLSLEYKFHLVQDEVDLISSLERAISFNLDLLDSFCGFLCLPVLFQHFTKVDCAFSILVF